MGGGDPRVCFVGESRGGGGGCWVEILRAVKDRFGAVLRCAGGTRRVLLSERGGGEVRGRVCLLEILSGQGAIWCCPAP